VESVRVSLGVLMLFAGFALLLITASGAVMLSLRQDQISAEVRRARDIDRQLIVIERSITNAETGQRGYLLTGRSEYLGPYDEARRGLPAEVAGMRALLSSTPAAAASFIQIEQLIDQKLKELQTTVALRSSGRTEDALAIVNNDSGQTLMDGLRRASDELSTSVRASLDHQRADLEMLNHAIRWALLASVLLVVLLSGLAAMDMRRRIRNLSESNAEMHRERDSREAAETQLRQLQRMEAVGQLTGGIAHDFNNMLAVIIGSLERAQQRLDADIHPRVVSDIKIAMGGAHRAAELTSQLLAFSRRQPLNPKVVDVAKLVSGMSEMLRRTLDASIHIETVFAGGLWNTFADPAQLESALLNLAVNARDAMPPRGGKLTIEASNADLDDRYASAHLEVSAGQYVMVSVTDNGSGMPPEVVDRAFEPFYSTKSAGKGTGLGLSQVFGFIKQSGGHVKIYSEVGRGTTVKVYLPRHFGALERAAAEPLRDVASVQFAGAVVLLVEDDVSVLDVSAEALRDLGYVVLPTASPNEALQILETREDIALLFTDVVMPEMTGRELADRARSFRPDLKVLYTSGYTRNAIVHNGVIDPGTVLLPKPFTIAQLAVKLEAILAG